MAGSDRRNSLASCHTVQSPIGSEERPRSQDGVATFVRSFIDGPRHEVLNGTAQPMVDYQNMCGILHKLTESGSYRVVSQSENPANEGFLPCACHNGEHPLPPYSIIPCFLRRGHGGKHAHRPSGAVWTDEQSFCGQMTHCMCDLSGGHEDPARLDHGISQ